MTNKIKDELFTYGLKLFDEMKSWDNRHKEYNDSVKELNEAVSAYGHYFNMLEWMYLDKSFLLYLYAKRLKTFK